MTSLIWRPVVGIKGGKFAESSVGVFRTHAAGGRTILTLCDVKVGVFGYSLRARRHAERLLEALTRRHAVPAVASRKRRRPLAKAGDGREGALPFNGTVTAIMRMRPWAG